ncbi:hypothetical protein [Micromonospora sp. LOL_027]|uniref:hypothetical protein n=1 Tax=Micromonospora sp. LOL_027 TaxID=3345419 RepID=UPI003A86A345
MRAIHTGRIQSLLACLVLMTIVIADPARSLADEPLDQEASTLVCLSPQHHQQVGRAAELLGLVESVSGDRVVVDGQRVAIARWRDTHRADFDTACATMVAAFSIDPDAARAGPTSEMRGLLIGGALTLVSALISALFTSVLTTGVHRRTEARQQAAQLRVAVAEFIRAADESLTRYADASARQPKGTSLDEPRLRLMLHLDALPAVLGPSMEVIRDSVETFCESMRDSWSGPDRSADSPRVREARTGLMHLRTAVEQAAREAERAAGVIGLRR